MKLSKVGINEVWSRMNILVNRLALVTFVILCQACISKPKIKAKLWINNFPVPSEVCQREPSLLDYGFYRKLSDGRLEFLSVCDKRIKDFFEMHKDDLARLLNEREESDSERAIKALK